jgi:hypothetical protein
VLFRGPGLNIGQKGHGLKAGCVARLHNVQLEDHNPELDSSNCTKGGIIATDHSVEVLKEGHEYEVGKSDLISLSSICEQI